MGKITIFGLGGGTYKLQTHAHVWAMFFFVFVFTEPSFVAQDTLKAWQEKNHPWLELSDVHKETTENIRVTVIPFYMGYRENQNTNVYWVRKMNLFAISQR